MNRNQDGPFEPYATISGRRQRLVPHLDDLLDAVFRLLPPVPDDRVFRVLDIGTASGLLVERMLEHIPDARIHVVHAQEKNLEAARQRLARFGSQLSYELGDYTRLDFDGPYDVVISELAASALENRSKRTLLSAAYAALRRGGRVISIIQLRGSTDALETRYMDLWHSMISELGATEADRHSADLASSKDRTATLGQQLEWMASDGFENVDCFVKFWRFAVVAGDKV